jgi:4-amino-4-deoxy-L-arabinose transferase-like glycosyltransferase
MRADHARYLGALLLVCAGLTLYRIWIIGHLGIDTYVDEAYYWGWSQALDWGYYSKPPMIAAMIAASEAVFGHTLVALKLPALLSYPLTALVLFALGTRLFSAAVGFWSGVVFLTIPLVSALGLFVSTDAPLMLFWALGLLGLVRALETGAWRHWLLVGVAFGLGMMTKYTMAAFAGSAFLVLLALPAGRRQLLSIKPWLAFAVGVALFMPNVLWNIDNAFPTFRHTAEITRLDARHWAPDEFVEFIGAQWLSFGPLLSLVLLAVLLRSHRLWQERSFRILVLMALPLLLLVCAQALTGRANGNWAAPAYVAGSVLVPAFLIEYRRHRLAAWAIGLNLVFGLLVYHWPDIARATNMTLNAKTDPYKRARGWAALSEQVRPFVQAHPEAILVGTERETLAQLIYHLQPGAWASWNPEGRVMDHYQLTTRLLAGDARPVLFVTESPDITPVAARFETATELGVVQVSVYARLERRRHVFLLTGFKGYQ